MNSRKLILGSLLIATAFSNVATAGQSRRASDKNFIATAKCAFKISKSKDVTEDELNYLSILMRQSREEIVSSPNNSLDKCKEFKKTRLLPDDYDATSDVDQRMKAIILKYNQKEATYQCYGLNIFMHVTAIVGVGVREGMLTCYTDNLRVYPLIFESSIYPTLGLGAQVSVSYEYARMSDGSMFNSSLLKGFGPYKSISGSLVGGIHTSNGGTPSSGGGDIDDQELDGLGVGVGFEMSSEYYHLPIPLYPRIVDWREVLKLAKN